MGKPSKITTTDYLISQKYSCFTFVDIFAHKANTNNLFDAILSNTSNTQNLKKHQNAIY